jgi:hypothetical protein
MKNIVSPLLFLILSALTGFTASAQTVLYSQNFDSTSSLPTGWYATPGSWLVDTSGGNISSGYPAASGKNNVEIQDTLARVGSDSLIFGPISTIGFPYISLDWGTRFSKHFADSGSTVSLYYSTNGTTWTQVNYIENPNNSAWKLDNDSMPVHLPAAAGDQASLWLMWVADIFFTPSGTYRIDDVIVTGSANDGIETIHADNGVAHVFVSGNSNINIAMQQPATGAAQAQVFDMTGRLMATASVNSQSIIIDASAFSTGMYLVRVSDNEKSMVTKVLVK